MHCMYCGKSSLNYPMYQVRQAIKPPMHPHRWRVIGHCCDDCHEDKGKAIAYEFKQVLPPELSRHA